MRQKNKDIKLSACRFYEKCDLSRVSSETCQSDSIARNYYGDGRPCGCYRGRLEREKGIVEKIFGGAVILY